RCCAPIRRCSTPWWSRAATAATTGTCSRPDTSTCATSRCRYGSRTEGRGRHAALAGGFLACSRGPFPTAPDRGISAMALLRIRLTGSDDTARAVINLLQSLDGIEHVEEVDDLMPQLDDADSSSAGLSDVDGPQGHTIEIDAPNPSTARRVRE